MSRSEEDDDVTSEKWMWMLAGSAAGAGFVLLIGFVFWLMYTPGVPQQNVLTADGAQLPPVALAPSASPKQIETETEENTPATQSETNAPAESPSTAPHDLPNEPITAAAKEKDNTTASEEPTPPAIQAGTITDATKVDEVQASVTIPASIDAEELLSRLKQIGQAMYQYHDLYGQFPVVTARKGFGKYFDKEGIPHLSWRVHLLPFLGQKELYDQFHLDEPWDSPNNRPLLDKMPEVYRMLKGKEPKTQWHVFWGETALFNQRQTTSVGDVGDGTRNTILVVQSGFDRAEFWTKPTNLEFNPSDPKASLGEQLPEKFFCLTADGVPHQIAKTVDPELLAALVTPSGKEIIDGTVLILPDGSKRDTRPTPTRKVGTLERAVKRMISPLEQRNSASKTPDENQLLLQLGELGVAMHLYHHQHGGFPPLFVPKVERSEHAGSQEKPHLSWRVHLLPLLGRRDLYTRFRLNEPWDSQHNKSLLPLMPDIYRTRGDGEPKTEFHIFSGESALFDPDGPTTVDRIQDDPASTILVVRAGADRAEYWTKPSSLEFDPDAPLAALGSEFSANILCTMADGTLLTLPTEIDPQIFKSLVTPNGRETVVAVGERYRFESGQTRKSLRSIHLRDEPIPAESKRITKVPPNGLKTAPASELYPVTAAARYRSYSKLKKIGIAMLNFEETYTRIGIPKNPAYFNEQGKPKLSWRVHLLAFVNEGELFQKFKLDEPWDSSHNQSLLDKMPEVYRADDDPPGTTNTRVMTLAGPGAMFEKPEGMRSFDITDGRVLTIMLVQTGRDRSVPWTKPEDIPFDPKSPLAGLGTWPEDGLHVVTADGTERVLNRSTPAKLFLNLATKNEGIPIDQNELSQFAK